MIACDTAATVILEPINQLPTHQAPDVGMFSFALPPCLPHCLARIHGKVDTVSNHNATIYHHESQIPCGSGKHQVGEERRGSAAASLGEDRSKPTMSATAPGTS